MHTGVNARPSVRKFFYWLEFSGALLLISEMLRMSKTFEFYHVPWLDVAANYAMLGTVWTVLALLGSAMLYGFEKLASYRRSDVLANAPRSVVLSLFLGVWLNLLRLLLASNGIKLGIGGALEMVGCVMVGAVVSVAAQLRFRTRTSQWMDTTTGQLGRVTWLFIAVSVVLTAHLFIEPLSVPQRASIALKQTGQKLPHVVIIILDGLAARDMSLYGYRLPTTPNLDNLTQTWTVYENAHSAGTGTLAAMPILLVGRYPYLDEWYRYGDLAHTGRPWMDLPQALRTLGYETQLFGETHPPSLNHLNSSFDRVVIGQATVLDALNTTRWSPVGGAWVYYLLDLGAPQNPGRILPEPMYENAERFFRDKARSGSSRPFFVYIHALRPSGPYLGEEFLGVFLPRDKGWTDIPSQEPYRYRVYSAEQQPIIDQLRLRYDENILKADEQVGRLIETLQQLDLYDPSLIIVTADHGTSFSSGYQGYGSERMLAAEHHIPLLVKFPYQTQGRRVADLVSNLDVLPTVFDAIGASYPTHWVEGQSLLSAGQSPSRVIYVRRPNDSFASDKSTLAAISGNLKLVNRQGELFLFDLADDPDEQNNLYGRVESRKLQDALSQFAKRMKFLQTGGDVLQAPPLVTQLP